MRDMPTGDFDFASAAEIAAAVASGRSTAIAEQRALLRAQAIDEALSRG